MRSQQMWRAVAMVGGLCGVLASRGALAQAWPTVFVAPFSWSTSSGTEYQWVGDAMAQALTVRLHKANQANYLSNRQVSAAIKSDNIDRTLLHSPEVSSRLGKLLGADYAVVSSYNAAWPDITFIVRIVDCKKAAVLQTITKSGHLDELVALEADLARQLATWPVLSKLPVKPAELGTGNLYAWRQLILGQRILWDQSLAPDKRPMLPPEAVSTALQHFTQATNLDPKFAQAWADKAISLSLLGRHAEAMADVAKALALSQADVPEVVLAGYYVHWRLSSDEAGLKAMKKDAGALQQAALKILRDAIVKRPGFLHARGYAGELLQALGKHDEAIAAFQDYLKQVPNQPFAMARIGYSEGKRKHFDDAIAITIKAVDLLPESPYLLLELSGRYIDAGKLMGAEDALKSAMQRFPEFATAYVRLGYVYLLQNKIDLAVPISEKALVQAQGAEQQRDRAYAYLNLVRAYAAKGDTKKAQESLQAGIDAGLTDLSQLVEDERAKAFVALPEVKALIEKVGK